MNQILSPIYLAGNKKKLLPSIMPHLLVEGRDTFIDLFGGSGTVSVNVNSTGHYKNILYNEKDKHIFGLQKHVVTNDNDFSVMQFLHNQYTKTKVDFESLRDSYNKLPCYDKLYLLMCRSNSNMIRFNKSGKYNMTFGDRKPFFLDRLREYSKAMEGVKCWEGDYRETLDEALLSGKGHKITVYMDAPYLDSIAQYNSGWSVQDNTDMLLYTDKLIAEGFKVIMSNIFSNRGKEHTQLIEWCDKNKDKIDVHHLDIDYGNSSFHKSNDKTDEVLVVSK